MSTRSKLIFGLLVVVLALREAGALGLDFYASESSWKTGSVLSAATETPISPEARANVGESTSRVIVKGDADLTERVEAALRGVLEGNLRAVGGTLEVDLTRTEMHGVYLLPIFKFADVEFACSYEVETRVNGTLAARGGSVDGSVNCVVRGVCSVRKFRELVAEAIAKAIAKRVHDTLQKK